MKPELRNPHELIPSEPHSRIDDATIDAVTNSIEQFGFRQPLVVNENGMILAGHTRWKAMIRLGLDKVPVVVVKDLTLEQARECRMQQRGMSNK